MAKAYAASRSSSSRNGRGWLVRNFAIPGFGWDRYFANSRFATFGFRHFAIFQFRNFRISPISPFRHFSISQFPDFAHFAISPFFNFAIRKGGAPPGDVARQCAWRVKSAEIETG
jgi:hypothetical protein